MTTKDVGPDDVREAERLHRQAEQAVADLIARRRNGDRTVTSDDIATAEQDARMAGYDVIAARQQAEQAAAAQHKTICERIRARLAQRISAARVAASLRTAEQANIDALAEIAAYNATINDGHDELHDAGVPAWESQMTPPAEHGHLGWNISGDLIFGERRASTLNANTLMSRMLSRARLASRTELTLRTADGTEVVIHYPGDDTSDMYAELEALDQPRTASQLHHYRGPTGTIFSSETPYSDDTVKRLNLTPVKETR
jgi:hypothetical protein